MVGAIGYRYFNWMGNNDIRLLSYLLFSELNRGVGMSYFNWVDESGLR
jgi:hypothetical protein